MTPYNHVVSCRVKADAYDVERVLSKWLGSGSTVDVFNLHQRRVGFHPRASDILHLGSNHISLRESYADF